MNEFEPNRTVGAAADPEKAKYASRVSGYLALMKEYASRMARIQEGGGKDRQEREHKRGKMLPRERIAALVDPDSVFQEIGTFVAEDMYEEEGGCPGGGTVMGTGHVSGRLCMIVANDATVKAGAWFPITAKKNLRAQEIALENCLPIIYLVDSAGVYLPMPGALRSDIQK
jgi:3-methylcrotonyl-CoA carboxylase beta subunit